jgi:ribosomal protein S18 acetylase RimI-like enzyme
MITIRRATPDNAAKISALLAGSWHRTYDDLMGIEQVNQMTALSHAPNKLADEINDPSIVTWIAIDGAGLVSGVVKIEKRKSSELYLDRLHIDPSAFGTGLADQLFNAALKAAGPHDSISLEVLEGNERAIAYYKKRGFSVTKTLDACGTALGVPTLLMTKSLKT